MKMNRTIVVGWAWLAVLVGGVQSLAADKPAPPPPPRADVPDERPLSPENARRLLEWDWLYQADGKPSVGRSLAEIGWARELAERIARQSPKLDFAAELAELAVLETKLKATDAATTEQEAKEFYFAVRRVKRRVTLKNPLLDFSRFLVIERPYPPGQIHQSDVLRGERTRDTVGRMVIVEGFDLTGQVRDLMPGHEGIHWRADLSYDGKRIVFSYKPKADKVYHLYEMNIDGTALRQLTNHPRYDDLTPIYLPDGHIMFCTTRCNTFVRCLPRAMVHVLARCDADGKNIYIISRNSENDWFPAMLPDGRVVYTRWEYTERQLWHIQKLWTINPDGTGEAHYWGNATAQPEVLTEAMPIPGTGRVMFTGTDHHHWWRGAIGVVDVSAGRDHNQGIWMVTPDAAGFNKHRFPPDTPLYSAKYHSAGKFWGFRNPVPLGAEDFLASATDGDPLKAKEFQGPPHSWLYLMDIHGNRELIHYNGKLNVFSPLPIRPRVRPPVLASTVAWPKAGEKPQDGLLYSPNVLEGVPEIPPGKAKHLRVIEQVHRTYTTGGKTFGAFQGPGTSATQADAVKRVLGTVALQADGSVYFRAPAGKALYFQLLDEHYRCLQIMRSFTGLMPSERRSCLGCHQQENTTPDVSATSEALRRGPVEITPPPWGTDVTVGYERFAQPVLDKHCGRCHQGKGKGRAKLDLTLRAAPEGKEAKFPPEAWMKQPYFTLLGKAADFRKAKIPADHPVPGTGIAGCMYVEYGGRGGTAGMTPLRPMTMLSYTSPLIDMVMTGKHNKVKIEGEDLLKLITWVDCNCVYRGLEEIRQLPSRGCRDAPTIERLQPVSDGPAEEKPKGEQR